MVVQSLSFKPHQISGFTRMTLREPPLENFPVIQLDSDSYIVGADIQTGIDLDPAGGRHSISIGIGCSLADEITFMVDLNHDYGAVAQGKLSFLQESKGTFITRRKGSIILQNDVWVGHGVTIMSGVTLCNGCAVAAGAVVTKDVPPYAIVGGNPARVIRYRFDAKTIEGLQKIAWWDWPKEVLMARKEDFLLPVSAFVEKYLPEAERWLEQVAPYPLPPGTPVVLFVPDLSDPYPLYPKVLAQYFETDRPNVELLLYVPKEDSSKEKLQTVESILQQFASCDTSVTMQSGETLNEHMLFKRADYFVTTRSPKTVFRTGLANLYDAKILYGTDEPMFPPDLR